MYGSQNGLQVWKLLTKNDVTIKTNINIKKIYVEIKGTCWICENHLSNYLLVCIKGTSDINILKLKLILISILV